MVHIGNSWDELLKNEWGEPYYQELRSFLATEYRSRVIYPPMNDIFNAFKLCAYEDVKVVILGQDPYYGEGQAHGLAFSVKQGVDIPPSLKNIYKEMESDIGFTIPPHGCLESWAKQGVFLLNTCLTVRQHQAFSHSGKGWETFTDAAIAALNRGRDNLVFMLWGAPAGRKAAFIDPFRHLVLQSAHPSPLSAMRGFMGNGHFLKCNEYLTQHGQQPIVW